MGGRLPPAGRPGRGRRVAEIAGLLLAGNTRRRVGRFRRHRRGDDGGTARPGGAGGDRMSSIAIGRDRNGSRRSCYGRLAVTEAAETVGMNGTDVARDLLTPIPAHATTGLSVVSASDGVGVVAMDPV